MAAGGDLETPQGSAPLLAVFKAATLPLGLSCQKWRRWRITIPHTAFRPLLDGFQPSALPLGLHLQKWRRGGVLKSHGALRPVLDAFEASSLPLGLPLQNGGTERTRTSTPKHYHLKVACTANFTTVPLNRIWQLLGDSNPAFPG